MHSGENTNEHADADSQAAHKVAWRRTLRDRRRARRDTTTPQERRAAGERLAAHLAMLPSVAEAGCLAVFEPLPTEPDLSPLHEVLGPHVRFLVPITEENLDLRWRDLATGDDLGRSGIAAADVVVAPALAVGPRGERLGQGGGSYDRALPRRRAGVPVVAVVFPDEVGLDLPTEPHDEPVTAVATSEGLTVFQHPDDTSGTARG